MAKSISEEELQLRKRARRRLIGAIALVAMVDRAVDVPVPTRWFLLLGLHGRHEGSDRAPEARPPWPMAVMHRHDG